MRTRFNVLLVVLLAFIAAGFLFSAASSAQQDKKPEDQRLSRKTPEGTLRIFALGVMLQNEQLIKATIVPVGAEDFRYLLLKTKGAQPDPKKLKEMFANMKVRTLKPGDKFTLPGGEKIVVAEEEVNDRQMVLVLENSPIPTRMYKGKGYWWVDARPVIDGRKAAEKARQKIKESKK